MLAFFASGKAGERDDTYFNTMCLPLVRDFIKRNNLPYASEFPTNKVSNRRVQYVPESGMYSSRMMLEKRYAFLFLGNSITNGITMFSDKRSAWSFGLMNPENETRMRELSKLTNLLDNASALELARQYFRLQGHNETNFHSVKMEQAIWARDVPSRRIVLPFYTAEWVRSDFPIDDYAHGVSIVISGVESNMVHYSKRGLPIDFGFDWNARTNPFAPPSP